MSMMTRTARMAWAASIPIRYSGRGRKPNSSMRRSAYRAQPSPWPEMNVDPGEARQLGPLEDDLGHLEVMAGHALVEGGAHLGPQGKRVCPLGGGYQVRPGRLKSSEGPV